jgi:hypothetical protein
MKIPMRIAPVGLLCLAVACGVVVLIHLTTDFDDAASRRPVQLPAVRAGPNDRVDDRAAIEDGGLGLARQFMSPIHDPGSLEELREAIQIRGRLGLAVLQAEFDHVRLPFRAPREQVTAAGQLLHQIGLLKLHQGRYPEAATCFRRALELGRPSDIPARDRAQRLALLGLLALRRDERNDRGHGPTASTGFFPMARPAVSAPQAGVREAVERFTAYLQQWPEDLRVRWFLNLAYMQLGEYPEKVPHQYRIPLDWLASTGDVGRFQDVAVAAGLTARGPNAAGGSVFDDFNGDGRPDLLVTAVDAERGASLWLNRGDGTFQDHSDAAGLGDQVAALNVTAADYDNDGDLDVLLVRGGGETPLRLSLLRNTGSGRFEDVTLASGLGEPIASGSAAWGDYDQDGRVDLFVCGEYASPDQGSAKPRPDSRNRCRLYQNRGDGTFRDVAATAGVTNEQCARGAAWGDYDDDGRLDLFVTNRDVPGRLYHNEGDGTFRDMAPSLDVVGPAAGSACWFWDYDNDGRLDLFVIGDQVSLAEFVAFTLGRPDAGAGRPRLYRNLGADGFREVAREVGLDRPLAALGCNFGDVDNDGFLDLYVGNGWRCFSSLVPDRMFRNVAGQRFEDVTLSAGTGSLRKGNSGSFADWDDDGDLDLFVETGGSVPGDSSDNLLFQNPGQKNHWLKLKLIGIKTNRAALGARIQVDLQSPDGRTRSIHRTVGNNSSCGGNSLVQAIGLGAATRVAAVTVSWPTSRTTQTFRDLAADQAIEITEGSAAYRVLPRRPSPPLVP